MRFEIRYQAIMQHSLMKKIDFYEDVISLYNTIYSDAKKLYYKFEVTKTLKITTYIFILFSIIYFFASIHTLYQKANIIIQLLAGITLFIYYIIFIFYSILNKHIFDAHVYRNRKIFREHILSIIFEYYDKDPSIPKELYELSENQYHMTLSYKSAIDMYSNIVKLMNLFGVGGVIVLTYISKSIYVILLLSIFILFLFDRYRVEKFIRGEIYSILKEFSSCKS